MKKGLVLLQALSFLISKKFFFHQLIDDFFVGYSVFFHVLSRIYLNGYFIKDNIDSFSEDIAYDLGYNDTDEHIAEIKDIIELMLDIGLLDRFCYDYESVFTSKAIQVQLLKELMI